MKTFRLFVLAVSGSIVTGGTLLVASGEAVAASFDCRQARAPHERFICANPEVDRMDVEMADLYRLHTARLSEPARSRVLAAQRSWLAFWPRVCSSSPRQILLNANALECVLGQYHQRMLELRPRGPGPGLQAYIVAQRRYLSPSQTDAAGARHESGFVQLEASGGHASPAWLANFNAWLAPSAVKGEPDNSGDAEADTDSSTSIDYADTEFIQVVDRFEFYGHGAAHPIPSMAYRHFLVERARPLVPADLFVGNAWKDVLAQNVLKALRVEVPEGLAVSTVREVVDLIDTPSGWDLRGPGLRLHFNPYAVAPYAMGFVTVAVPSHPLRAHLTELGRRLLRAGSRAD